MSILKVPEKTIIPGIAIFAVDFDGVLCEDQFPNIGILNLQLIEELKDLQRQGHKIILWTNRTDHLTLNGITYNPLNDAVNTLAEKGLIPDAVNKNIPEVINYFQTESPSNKITADIFLDDRAYYYRFKTDICHCKDCISAKDPKDAACYNEIKDSLETNDLICTYYYTNADGSPQITTKIGYCQHSIKND